MTGGPHCPLSRCWHSHDRQLFSLESSTLGNIVGGRCGQVGPEKDRKNRVSAAWYLQLKDLFTWTFEVPFGGIPETTKVQTKEKELKYFYLDRCINLYFVYSDNSIPLLFLVHYTCLFYFCDMPMHDKPCCANAFDFKNERFTQKSLGMENSSLGYSIHLPW